MLTPVHDCPSSEARIPFAVAATIDGGATSEGIWRTSNAFVLLTIATKEAGRKSLCVEVGNAGFLVWEVLLKVWKILGYKAAPVVLRHRWRSSLT